jgi:hypothetical protein
MSSQPGDAGALAEWTQFYAMLGSGAIWHDGWKAVTTHMRVVDGIGRQPGVEGDLELRPEPPRGERLVLRVVRCERDEPDGEGGGVEVAGGKGAEAHLAAAYPDQAAAIVTRDSSSASPICTTRALRLAAVDRAQPTSRAEPCSTWAGTPDAGKVAAA